jgi:phosphoglycolate phosphatase
MESKMLTEGNGTNMTKTWGGIKMRGAIFDLDGTLADTAADLLGAANAVLAPRGLPMLELARDKSFAGRGGRSMICRSLSMMERPPNDAEADMIAIELYPGLLRAYEGRLAEETRLYDGVIGCLDALEATGWRLSVCTNKPERLAVMLLDSLGVLGRFGAVLGADTLPVRKPDPEHLFETARRSGARPDLCVMLGDTETDLLTARAAGVPCVLTSFGFAEGPLSDLTPDAVIDHFDEIAPVLERLCPLPAKTA